MKSLLVVIVSVIGCVMGHGGNVVSRSGQDITINIAAPSDMDDMFVAFSVGSSRAFSPRSTARIPMEVVIYNDGGHFHANDNRFHVPVNGIYSLTFSGLSAPKKPLSLHLYRERAGKAKVMMARAYDHSTSGHNGAGASIIVRLDKGDTVSLWSWANHPLYGAKPPYGPTTLLAANGAREYHVSVSIINPETEHALDKYRCCWGDYSLKLVFDKDMLEWQHINTQPANNYTYQQSYRASYDVPVGNGDGELGELKGFLLRYTRMQGERYVSDHITLGFFGILEMSIHNASLTRYRYRMPHCVFWNVSKSHYANRHTVACIRNRGQQDDGVNEMVRDEFPNATYFDSTEPLVKGTEMAHHPVAWPWYCYAFAGFSLIGCQIKYSFYKTPNDPPSG